MYIVMPVTQLVAGTTDASTKLLEIWRKYSIVEKRPETHYVFKIVAIEKLNQQEVNS